MPSLRGGVTLHLCRTHDQIRTTDLTQKGCIESYGEHVKRGGNVARVKMENSSDQFILIHLSPTYPLLRANTPSNIQTHTPARSRNVPSQRQQMPRRERRTFVLPSCQKSYWARGRNRWVFVVWQQLPCFACFLRQPRHYQNPPLPS